MILQRLFRLLDGEGRIALRRFVYLTLLYCFVQGVTMAFVLPIIRTLLGGDLSAVGWWLVPFLAGTILTWWLSYRATLGGFEVAIAMLRSLRHRLGDHVVTLPMGWFTPFNTGRLGMTLSQGVMDILGLPARQLTPLVRAVATPLVLVSVMAFLDWRVALVAALVFPPVALVYWWAGRLGRAADQRVHATAADSSERMVEFAQSQAVLRAFGCGERGHASFDAALLAQTRANRSQLWMVLPPLLANSWIGQLSFLALMASVTSLALSPANATELTVLVAMLVLVNRIVDPLTEVAVYSSGMRMAAAHIDTIEAILAAEPLPAPTTPAAAPQDNGIELDRVNFGYQAGTPVLETLSLTLPANTITALVGPSGAGKTTILRLIARFWDPDGGAVRIGGVDVRQLDAARMMQLVAPVFQDTYLFTGSLRENVLLGRPNASEGELRRVAALARLDEVVARLPEGWDSAVGEGGSLLSGGERQRVAIARALLKQAPILLLDEATGALDAENQAAVIEGLGMLRGQATILVITHQLSTIRRADRIVVMDEHRIVETGTHRQLAEANGRYAALWRAMTAAGGWATGIERRLDAPARQRDHAVS